MKLPLRRWLFALSLSGLALSGCGHHAPARPASALTEKDRTVLARYEEIRAALAGDDLRAAKRAGTALSAYLKKNPDPALSADAEAIGSAAALDRARQSFETLSTRVVKLADGVEGYYIFDTPIPANAEWVQRTLETDNPYTGRAMHDVGTLRK